MQKNKKIYFFLFFVALINFTAFAQSKVKETVTGIVEDAAGPIIGATVIVKNNPGLGQITDMNGKFTLKASPTDVIVVSYVGYGSKEVVVGNQKNIRILLEESTAMLEETVVVGKGTQRKVSVIGAISTLEVKELKSPTSSITNALAGNIAGVVAVQRSGEPGKNVSDFWIRGISTFGANSGALILVDGIERSMNEVDPEDIESFSILKDASATAVYGVRGANGVVMITTKRGKEGKVNISVKAESSVSYSGRMPQYVGAYDYAKLANEARVVRGESPIYNEQEISIIKYGLDPDIYPNVNWQKEVLSPYTQNYRAGLNISGGGATARYYISGGMYNESGMYKQDNLNKYNTNVDYKRYNFRSNVDVNITPSTVVELGVGGWVVAQNKPGSSSDNIWGSMATLTAISVPVMYSNGLTPSFGKGTLTNPSVLLTKTGFSEQWENKIETNITVKQDFDFLLKGLSMYGRYSFDAYNWHKYNRFLLPELYRADKFRDADGKLVYQKVQEASPVSFSREGAGDRRTYGELAMNYSNMFGNHRVGGLLLYNIQEYASSTANDEISSIPYRNQGLSGRATYSYDDRYFVELNFGYNGSENFEKGSQYGFFPAYALGWLVSNEKFWKENVQSINLLKLKFTQGLVGNDKLSNTRFPYRTYVGSGGGYYFGDFSATGGGGIAETVIGSQYLTWETSDKLNLGIELGLFKKFKLNVDIFKDDRSGIFMKRTTLPETVGISSPPWGNVGRMINKGIDGTIEYSDKIGKLQYTLRGNATFNRNTIVDYDEPKPKFPYQTSEGFKYSQQRGYIALGLFEDATDVAMSPRQDLGGTVQPGDIKYKDVNGDGVINSYDIVPIGYSNIPELTYGFGLSMYYKDLDFSMLFQGSGNSTFFYGGYGMQPFYGGETGNVLTIVADQTNRWTPASYSGNPATENPNARFPRMSYGENKNNTVNSTYWQANGRYLRFKNLEVGYTLPRAALKGIHVSSCRVYFSGFNIFVWDLVKMWDPELASGNGTSYPIQTTFNLGLNMKF